MESVEHGRWVHTHRSVDFWEECWKCSVCGSEFPPGFEDDLGDEFCPECGAKMDGDEEPGFRAKDFAETYAPEIMRGIQDGLKIGDREMETLKRELGIVSPSEAAHKMFYGEGWPDDETDPV